MFKFFRKKNKKDKDNKPNASNKKSKKNENDQKDQNRFRNQNVRNREDRLRNENVGNLYLETEEMGILQDEQPRSEFRLDSIEDISEDDRFYLSKPFEELQKHPNWDKPIIK